MKNLYLAILLLLFTSLFAQELFVQDEPYAISATDRLADFDAAGYLKDLSTSDPAKYQRLLNQEYERRAFNASNKTQQFFWALNLEDLSDPIFYQITATLRSSSMNDSLRIWVDDESWNSGYVDASTLFALATGLLTATPQGSIDSSSGILKITERVFGERPNKGGDGFLNVLILDIQDSFDPESTNRAFVGGYFFPFDQSDFDMSNQQDILYLDSFPGIFSPISQELRTESVLATTAHEVQHLIHYTYDSDENTWLNESMSELASFLCGYSPGSPALYLAEPGRSLTSWNNEVWDYSRVGLWGVYLYEQLGLEFITALTQDARSSLISLENLLATRGSDFETTFRNFAIANILNDADSDSRFGYQDNAYSGLRATTNEVVSSFPALLSASYDDYGVAYYRVQGSDLFTLSLSQSIDIGYLLRNTGSGVELIPINDDTLAYSQFNSDDEFYVMLSGSIARNLNVCAYATRSFDTREDVYDSGQIDLRINGAVQIANRFVLPAGGFKLREIEFQNTASGQFSIRFQRDSNGVPGGVIATIGDTSLQSGQSVIRIQPPASVVNSLIPGQIFYVSVNANAADFAYAYSDGDFSNNNSFIYRSPAEGWQNLSNFQVDGERLQGNWMIRAFYDGELIASGNPNCAAESFSGELKLTNVFPNPTASGITVSTDFSGAGTLRLTLYNMLGQEVSHYQQVYNGVGKILSVSWPNAAKNTADESFAPGIYFIRGEFSDAETGKTTYSNTQKIIILKN